MMKHLEQLALLDVLLENWELIQLQMGTTDQAAQQGLAEISQRLVASASTDEISLIVDDLLDLTMDTPAYDFVRELVARATPRPEETQKVRSDVAAFEENPIVAQWSAQGALESAHQLGYAITLSPAALPVPVFFATNRKLLDSPTGQNLFGGELSPNLTLGRAEVTIPVAAHRMGRLETPSWWNLFADARDERHYVVLRSLKSLSPTKFSTQLEEACTSDPDASDVLVFLHGYRVTFVDAARRAAQLAYDLNIRGPVVLFSWPSLGSYFGYSADEDRASVSGEALANFLQTLEGGPWNNLHLVAHSMGTRVLLSGLADYRQANLPVGQVVFVASDLYVNTFQQKFPKMLPGVDAATSYVSRMDRALLLSSLIHWTDRIGIAQGEPFVSEGLETVDATEVDTSLIGHGYFSDERTVLTDLGFLIRERLSAERRGLRRYTGKKYWIFPR